jgi:hypothetical protein
MAVRVLCSTVLLLLGLGSLPTYAAPASCSGGVSIKIAVTGEVKKPTEFYA